MISTEVGTVDFATLGHLGDAWTTAHCRVPDGFARGKPYVKADWQFWVHANRYRIREDATYVDPSVVAAMLEAIAGGSNEADQITNEDLPSLNQAFTYRRTMTVGPQKALALDTPIATPSGWTTMGEIQVGDEVFDEQGVPTRVLSKSPVWESDTYRVEFSDGATLVACKDHQWWVERRTPSGTYVEDRVRTEDLAGNLVDSHGARRFRVSNAMPLDLPAAALPVDPYTLGAWLGDGHSDDGRITGIDDGVFDRIEAAGFEVRRGAIAKRRQVIGLAKLLRVAGVLRNKHIPAVYLRSSAAQRWALLQGLMDTDGYADARQGKCEFTTTLPALRDGVLELLATLGVKPLCFAGEAKLNGRITGPKWRISFAARADMPVFGLTRKQDRLKPAGVGHAQYRHRRIVAVERTETVPTQCLTVAAESHVFLAGREMIPTCNTGKGPNSATEVAYEAAGPSVFAGFAEGGEIYRCEDNGCPCGWTYPYRPGMPMGMRHPSPLIQITATNEDQTDNIFRPLRSMIRLGPLKKLLAVREGFVRVLGMSGDDDLDRIDAVTASATGRLGNPISDAEQDEAGLYTKSNKLLSVASTQNRGAAGMGGRTHITTNAWDPTQNSYAQQQYESGADDLFVFYRNPDLEPSLLDKDQRPISFHTIANRRRIFQYVYEGSWWVNIDSIEAEARELMKTDPAQAERFFGNRLVQGGGAWLPDGWWSSAWAGHDAA